MAPADTIWHKESLKLKEIFGTREGFEICPHQLSPGPIKASVGTRLYTLSVQCSHQPPQAGPAGKGGGGRKAWRVQATRRLTGGCAVTADRLTIIDGGGVVLDGKKRSRVLQPRCRSPEAMPCMPLSASTCSSHPHEPRIGPRFSRTCTPPPAAGTTCT